MEQRRIDKGRVSEKGHGLGTVTEEMVRQRARELAVINGRTAEQVLDSDLGEARRELTGEERLTPKPTLAEQLPEESRWVSVPESSGHEAPKVSPPDEQAAAEELVEEGVEEAEHDQMIRAVREQNKRDREG